VQGKGTEQNNGQPYAGNAPSGVMQLKLDQQLHWHVESFSQPPCKAVVSCIVETCGNPWRSCVIADTRASNVLMRLPLWTRIWSRLSSGDEWSVQILGEHALS
jgi:hypothetical protein